MFETPKSRSTWACELKCKFMYSFFISCRSRSTWACELKLSVLQQLVISLRHAPRERVSWNWNRGSNLQTYKVTLHVSVWVEMSFFLLSNISRTSRSTWACELKFFSVFHSFPSKSHAPRERVSWNDLICSCIIKEFGHAPRERVSWNWPVHRLPISYPVTLHVSVWVEIWRWKHG